MRVRFERAFLVLRGIAAAALLSLGAVPAVADDLADEADLHFRLGALRWQAGDYEPALQHFLTSNRLVPNRNVVFNVARTFEKLKRYADAHRWYSTALEAETDPAAKARVQEALDRLAPFVAVLRVVTDPPGATVYVDRRDLGPRGSTPRVLAFEARTVRVLVEKEGHEPAASAELPLKLGAETNVTLKLEPILGTVEIAGGPPGATVTIDDPTGPALGPLPRTVPLPPGRHVLHVRAEGHRGEALPVEVSARTLAKVRPTFVPLTGRIVVNVDEPEALIEVDGRPMGFAPAVLTVPVGARTVRVTKAGFRPLERAITVRTDLQERLELQLNVLEEVSAASRVTESIEEAPASVTILPSRELRAFAYPTLAEALRGVRGISVSDDRTYATAGVRGFSSLGDYGSRLLVLVDGMPVNDDWIGSSYLGYDQRTDLADIERIEIVRGAGSVLYGTGAMSGVVNLVPRGRGTPTGVEAGISSTEEGTARARVAGSFALSEETGGWVMAGVAKGFGLDFDFPALATPGEPGSGRVEGLDGFEAATTTGRLWSGDFNLQWGVNQREKEIATAPHQTIVGEPTVFTDRRLFAELRHEPRLSDSVTLLSRVHANRYGFDDVLPHETVDGGTLREQFRGTWFGLEERIAWALTDALRLTVGGELQLHVEVHQRGEDPSGTYLDEDPTFEIGAGYLLVDWALFEALKLQAGARLDAYSTFGVSLNPRLAIVADPWEGGTVKLLGGKAFRAPSIYELYYADGGATQVASPELDPETSWTSELEVTHRFAGSWSAIGAIYGNYIDQLIVQEGTGTPDDLLHYVNSDAAVLTTGGELELRRDWRQGWSAGASYSFARTRYLGHEDELREVANVPLHLAAIKGAVPLVGRSVTGATRLSFEGPRWDRNESVDEPTQRRTEPAVIWDLVLSGKAERHDVRWSLGLYNALDWSWDAPVSGEYAQRTIPQPGRSVQASVTVGLY